MNIAIQFLMIITLLKKSMSGDLISLSNLKSKTKGTSNITSEATEDTEHVITNGETEIRSDIKHDPAIIETGDLRNISMPPLFNVSSDIFQINPLKIQFPGDGSLSFTELARKYIRPAEEYDITTKDGYKLTLFRIPGNTSHTVLFCHGILVSSDNYLIRGKTSLLYMIAAQGFDVWAMNFRGNRYARRHVTLDPDKGDAFWQFSMHEIGIYDYKAVIDFILDKTRNKQLSVVAHSEGASAFFILTSVMPEYNKKIKVFVGLAPVCYLRHSGPTLTAILKASRILNLLLKLLGIEEFVGYFSFAKKITDAVCSKGIAGYELCFNKILGSVTGFNPENIEQEFATTILRHFPAGTSRRNLEHYAHVYRFNNFVQYDYGLRNFAMYGSFIPPAYDLKKVTAKVALFAAEDDKIVGVKDIERLKTDLTNVVHYQVVSDDKFSHIDYIWGRNAHIVLYPFVIDILLEYS